MQESLKVSGFCQDGEPAAAIAEQGVLERTSTLRHLCLKTASISSEWLLHILICSAHSLHTVHFEHLNLTSGTWGATCNYMAHKLPLLQEVTFRVLGYDPSGSSAHLHHEYGGARPGDEHKVRLHTAEPTDFQFLWNLEEVVAARTRRPFAQAIDRPVFGPRTRPYTLLDHWLDIPPWRNIEDDEESVSWY